MEFENMPLPYSPSTTLPPQEEVALAAANWVKMGFPVEVRKNGLPTDDPRSPEQRKDPVATYFILREIPDLGLAIKTGPKTGLLAIAAYTYDETSGLRALRDAGFYCPHCDSPIRHDAFMEGEWEGGFHTMLYYVGKETFLRTALSELDGVVVEESGEVITIPPGICDYGLGLGVGLQSTYEGFETLAPVGIPYLPDGLRKMIRAAERQDLADKRKPNSRRGVLPELYAPVAEGGRNNALARRAGFLLGVRKLTEEQTLKALLDINQR
uniref:primase C-terminal domain-containing protein n=1 Tax=Yoonia sp. TaxID=2212373 RepID=UPI0040487F38